MMLIALALMLFVSIVVGIVGGALVLDVVIKVPKKYEFFAVLAWVWVAALYLFAVNYLIKAAMIYLTA